jgi:hypothetical protein
VWWDLEKVCAGVVWGWWKNTHPGKGAGLRTFNNIEKREIIYG